MYYKILRKDMTHYGMKYVEGLNVDVKPFDPTPCCGSGGLFFTDVKNILEFINYGDLIAEVTIPDGEVVIPVRDIILGDKYKAHSIILSNIRELWDIEVLEDLVAQGADIHAWDDSALRWVADKGHLEVVRYLINKGADIHARNNEALKTASENGHLEVVKYLVKQGSDIHANDDYALQLAAGNGHLDVVKYLVEQGADIHADDECALRWAAFYGHIEVVKYLVEQGANIHAEKDYALIGAAEAGYLDIVKYLVEHGANISKIDKYYVPVHVEKYLITLR